MNTNADAFEAYLLTIGLADSTVRVYKALWVRWARWATDRGVDPLNPTAVAVREWSRHLPGTASVLHQARAVISHACAWQQQPSLSAVVRVPRPAAGTSRALEPAAAAKLAATAEQSGAAGTAVLVALYTAARRAEVAGLAWRDVDLEGCTITLVRPKTRDRHTLPLHPELHRRLAAEHVPGEHWVFPGRWGGHVSPSTVWSWVLAVAEQAGIGRVTPHQLRHTALTDANDATGDLRAVQQLAGHASPTVTARYTRASLRRLQAAVAALDYSGTTNGPAEA